MIWSFALPKPTFRPRPAALCQPGADAAASTAPALSGLAQHAGVLVACDKIPGGRARIFACIATRVVTAVVTIAALPIASHAQAVAKRVRIDDSTLPANLQAEQMTGRPDREIIMERDVEISRGATVLHADHATYNVIEDEVEATGNVRMKRYGDDYTGEALKLKMDSGEGYVSRPTYKLEINHAQGTGQRIDFQSRDNAVVTEGIYSTCESTDPDWYLKATTLNLDTGREIGVANSTIVYFKGVPILAAPSMSFPLSNARKSGWLPPTIGTTSTGGFEVLTPYYLNIAPNRDVTLYPKLITKRGVQLGADGRYLGETYGGETKIEGLQNDQQTKTNRWAITSTHHQSLTPALSFAWNINSASDDNYPSDFARSITTSAQRLLPRNTSVNYAGNFWRATLVTSTYQVLQDPAAPITKPFDRLPQISLNAGRQDVEGFDWSVDNEVTRFQSSGLQGGERLVVNPKISYPIIGASYFLTPKLAVHATRYNLDSGTFTTGTATTTELSRVLPTFSLDGGLIFERESSLLSKAMTQTLEPRLFYVRTPYKNQSLFPLFDTGEADLSFSQLFSENRFVGNDRVSDANQLTTAVTTRFIESTGAERLRVALGQRFYFSDPLVALTPISSPSRSDLLASVNGQVTSMLALDANIQYSQSASQVNRANFGARWQPAPKQVLNLEYRRDVPNSLQQAEFSTQWPVAKRWYGVARVNYSLLDHRIAEGLGGVEYKADCWVFRIVGQRTPTATNQTSSSLFFQLELNGLTRLGSNPLDAIRTSVPGYQLINPRNNM